MLRRSFEIFRKVAFYKAGPMQAHKEERAFIFNGSKAELDPYIQTNINTLFSLEAVGMATLNAGELK